MKLRKNALTALGLLPLLTCFLLVGCGGSGDQPEATDVNDVRAYLDAHPELKEPKPEVDNSILTGEGS